VSLHCTVQSQVSVETAHNYDDLGIQTLIHPPESLEVSWETWSVLAVSFGVDGYVLTKTLSDLKRTVPENSSETYVEHHNLSDAATLVTALLAHIRNQKDPFIIAVLYEGGEMPCV
jgi:zinc transporter 9